jgi:uncharacterized cupredoxin-like copper-binding protein
MRYRVWTTAALAVLAASAFSCAGDEPAATSSPEAGVATTLSDFKIKPAEAEADAGPVTFDLTNDGPSEHSFLLVRTDLAEDELPLTDHVVDIEQLEVVGQVDRIEADAERAITAELAAGDYVMFCNLTGHYESDMHAAFAVI